MNKKLLLVGAGGHCRSVIDSIDKNKYSDIVLIDRPEKVGQKVSSFHIAGTDNDLEKFYNRGYEQAFISLGSIGNPAKRRELFGKLKNVGFSMISIIDLSAIVSSNIEDIGEGVFIGKGAIVNTGVRIDECAIINSGAIIDHDCNIGAFVHIGPGVSLSGGVQIHENTHVGTGSSVIQSISIGKNSIIGAGSVVVTDIAGNVTAFGTPCKPQY